MTRSCVTLALCAILATGCGGSASSPSASSPPLTEVTNSAHYVVHSAPGDGVNTAWQDAYYEWLIGALQLQTSPRLPPLASLLRSSDFATFDPEVTYPCAGSFVRYLIDTYGLAPLKAYFASATFDDAATVTESRFLAAYGRSLASVWDEWRAWVRTSS